MVLRFLHFALLVLRTCNGLQLLKLHNTMGFNHVLSGVSLSKQAWTFQDRIEPATRRRVLR